MCSSKSESATGANLTLVLAILAIAIGYMLNPVNGSLVVTAYPTMADYFQVPYAHMSTMIMLFMAATAAAQPLSGGLGDIFGRKNVFLLGVLGFMVASVFAGLAGSFVMLVFWRMAQAVFSGLILANGVALVALVAPRERAGSYLGVLNSAMTGAAALGFPAGGMILHAFDWHMLFWINIPFGLASLLLGIFYLPGDKSGTAKFTSLSFIGLPLVPLAFVLQAIIRRESTLPYLVLLFLAVAIWLYSFLRSNSSRAQLATINNRQFNLSCIATFFTAIVQFGIIFTMPAWILVSLGIGTGLLGVYFMISSVCMLVISPIVGRYLDNHDARWVKLLALTVMLAELLILLLALNTLSLAVAMVFHGLALAIIYLLAQRSAFLVAPSQSQALAMGLFSSFRAFGSLLGNALAAVILAQYAEVTAEAGREVMFYIAVLCFWPIALALVLLTSNKAEAKP
ncbi:MFS transporter [Halioxenophilus sp. WMMB6]|uniref:MFS transporter n=1 Tax=Halioxenophilus sp. WMMB6 TaxID=3073815 RepID=UPI00295F1BF0|nr:MFS transporter [Halioxenophilus sp. WMMB6]